MGYEIVYDPVRNKKAPGKEFCPRLWMMSTVFFFLFCCMLPFVWQEGAAFLKRMILPVDLDVFQQGWEGFLSALNTGEGFRRGLEVFCEQVIAAGYLGA